MWRHRHASFSYHLTAGSLLALLLVITVGARWLPSSLTNSKAAWRIPPIDVLMAWKCPVIMQQPNVECSCDIPHTLRCTGDKQAMQIIGRKLRSLPQQASVSLLDCTVQNMSSLPGPLLEGVALHGLVVSSAGEIRDVHKHAFVGLASPLQALGLPNNQLSTVPTSALAALPMLDRLDLSHNKLKKLDNSSFVGLGNLTFLDLSDNELRDISIDAFDTLPELCTLRLRNNKLTVPAVATLKLHRGIQDLDLSSNFLAGPLSQTTLIEMPTLRDLQLSHNSLSSLRNGVLKGFSNLTSLSLHHNKIDVLEDHAFSELSSLVQLDLAHNRIVAVSGASLAHLSHLEELDLSHNFLRALTADLIQPLVNLKELNLDDNDISIIAKDSFKPDTVLHKLSLADNPLNCDCRLIDYAIWLNESKLLSTADKNTAVCMTPPSLENALLSELSTDELLCSEDEQEALMAPAPALLSSKTSLPFSRAQVTLRKFSYDGITISLDWTIDEKAIPYTCDAIFVYEEEDDSVEDLLEVGPLTCNSSEIQDPRYLSINVPANIELQVGHYYRYCIVLLDYGQQSDELLLILGCSEIIPLLPTTENRTTKHSEQLIKAIESTNAKIMNVNMTVIETGEVLVNIDVKGSDSNCLMNIAVLENNQIVTQKEAKCNELKHIFKGLDRNSGRYTVCVTITGSMDQNRTPVCTITEKIFTNYDIHNLNITLVVICITFSLIFMVMIWCLRKCFFKPTTEPQQYFLPVDSDEQQYARYIKLQATTKV